MASTLTVVWWRVTRDCADDLATVAAAEATRLEAEYPAARLNRIAAAGGLATPPDPST